MPERKEPYHQKESAPIVDENGLFPEERALIMSMSQQAKSRIRGLIVESLSKKKGGIIGFRTDDIFSLCRFAEKGVIPTRNLLTAGSMAKDVNGLYLSPNPESSELKRALGERPAPFAINWQKAVKDNLNIYGNMAARQAIARHIVDKINGDSTVLRAYKELGNEALQRQYLINDLLGYSENANTDTAIRGVANYLGWRVGDVKKIINAAKQRGGIFIGVNTNALSSANIYQPSAADKFSEEIILVNEQNEIPFSCIAGIEPLGDIEEHVVELLNK